MNSPPQTRLGAASTAPRDRTHLDCGFNSSSFTSSLQPFADLRREHRIRSLSARFLEAYGAGDKATARRIDTARVAEIRARSPRQVARMEAGIYKRARRTIKQGAMYLHLRGALPAWLATATFRVFRLRSV
jgi:hypothetical protein